MDRLGYAVDNLYGFFHYTTLSRLPERLAVPLGRWLFKRMPLEWFDIYDTRDERLEVDLDGLKLPNPVILAACYHDPKILEKAMKLGFGAVVGKATREPRKGNPEPTILRKGTGFVNSDGYQNQGVEELKGIFREIRGDIPLGVSITGDSIDDYLYVVGELGPFVDFMELNLGCPNTDYGLSFYSKPERTRDLFKGARMCTSKPLIVKVARGERYSDTNFGVIVPNAIREGIRIIDHANTLEVEEPRFHRGIGALSGPELFEDTKGNVGKMRTEFGKDIRIIATGGIDDPGKAYRAMRRGASAVGFITGFITEGPMLPRRINDYILERLEESDMENVEQVVGSFWH